MGNFFDRLLIDYLPTVLKDVREYKVVTAAEQPEIFDFFGEIQTALDNQFIMYLTEYGVKRWEKIIGIVPKATYTLEERKFTILTMLSKRLPYTYRMLHQVLTELCGEDNYIIDLDANAYALTIWLEFMSDNNAEIVAMMLKQLCPANLICYVGTDTSQRTTIYYLGAMFSTKTHNLHTSITIDRTINIDKTGEIYAPVGHVVTQRIT